MHRPRKPFLAASRGGGLLLDWGKRAAVGEGAFDKLGRFSSGFRSIDSNCHNLVYDQLVHIAQTPSPPETHASVVGRASQPLQGEEGRYKATWRRESKIPWREAGPPHHLDDNVDFDQTVVNKELSLRGGCPEVRRKTSPHGGQRMFRGPQNLRGT